MRDAQNTVVTGGVVGSLATTSYGPRLTNKTSPSSRPMSWAKREIVLQLDGDVSPELVADFVNNTLHAMPAGCFLVDAVAYGNTAANISLVVEDVDGNVSPAIVLAPAANAWVAVRDIDFSVLARAQITGTIGAGERAVVVLGYIQTETPGVDGVLAKAGANQDDSASL